MYPVKHATQWTSSLGQQPEAVQVAAAHFTAVPSGKTAPYSLFAPLHYEAGYAYPLVVWLHGTGADERQLIRVMPMISMRNYVAVAPRGLLATWGESGEECFGWTDNDQCADEAEERILECIETACRRFHIARHRVFLAGFQGGGTMALRVGMRHPEPFAGIVSLCGPLPASRAIFSKLPAARRLEIFLAAGRHGDEYPTETLCDNLRLLHCAGMSVTVRQYPCVREMTPAMLADVDRWLIERITAAKARSLA